MRPKRVITFGTYDLFHIGHLQLLRRAAILGESLVVGISTDELNESKKGYRPVFSFEDRCAIISAIDVVDEIFAEESLDLKREYIIEQEADLLVMGSDWEGRFDYCGDICTVHYLPRTQGISTTELKRVIRTSRAKEF